jgi:galactose mutarotase-like enzyme
MVATSLITSSTHISGLEQITLANGRVVLNVFPQVGAKIYDLIDVESGFNLLWHNPRVPLEATRAGTPFDDTWAGGWDELFPTDVACAYGDNTYPDHGDLWSGPWHWELQEATHEAATVHLWRESICLPCRADKWITIAAKSDDVVVNAALTNTGPHTIDFMWNQHIAHAIGDGSRLHLPASGVVVEPPTLSRAGKGPELEWPVHPGWGDLSQLPSDEAGVTEFLYPKDLAAGWVVVTHPSQGVALRVAFDTSVFTTPWVWGVFGGWRGHHFLLTEPCTSRPGSLAAAIDNGSSAHLDSGQTLNTVLIARVTHSFDRTAPGNIDPTAG